MVNGNSILKIDVAYIYSRDVNKFLILFKDFIEKIIIVIFIFISTAQSSTKTSFACI